MPDNESLTLTNNSAIIDTICFEIYQAILEIQQQQPELLKEKYRNVLWQIPRNQATLLGKLKEGLNQKNHQQALLSSVQKFLQILLTPDYFESPSFANLMEQIRVTTQQAVGENNSATIVEHLLPVSSPPSAVSEASAINSPGIAILLLDAENLQLDAETEKFLAGICSYPLQIKIAFANWRTMGKHDLEFHRRGYELIHVPAGKDSADVKMATVGSSIFVHYPTAREVFVCSSDKVLTHLCNTLQTHGLTVYSVCKQGDTIRVLNNNNGHSQAHSLRVQPDIPSLEEFIAQLQKIITNEQKVNKHHWVKLSKISQVYKNKYNLTISQVVSSHLPGKRARDIFLEYPAQFVTHQPLEQSEIYITVFNQPTSTNVAVVNNSAQSTEVKVKDTVPLKIKSKVDLEESIVEIVQSLTAESPGSFIDISRVGSEFKIQYGQTIKETITQLNINMKYITFLQSCSTLTIKKQEQMHSVAIAKL